MILIAILLGIGFALLGEIAWLRFEGCLSKVPGRLQTIGNWMGYLLALCVFVAIAFVFIHGLYAKYTGDFGSWTVSALYFVAVPQLMGVATGFLVGAMGFWFRRRLAQGRDSFLAAFQQRRLAASPPPNVASRESAGEGKQGDGRGAGDSGGKEPYPWLTSIVGIAAVTLVAIVTLVMFFPEILMRVESIKVGGVEARFATAANQAARISIQSGIDAQSTNDVLDKWATYDRSRTIGPAQALIDREWSSSQAERDEAAKIWAGGDLFIDVIAKPVAGLIVCYRQYVEIRDTAAQYRAAMIADEWGRLFKSGTDARLDEAVHRTYEMLFDLDNALAASGRQCDGSSPWGRMYQDSDCVPDCLSPEKFKLRIAPVVGRLRSDVANFTRNGLAIAFVANLYSLTHRPAVVAEFMDFMANRVDKRRGTLLARLTFYRYKSDAKFAARSPVPDRNGDLQEALTLTESVIGSIKSAKGKSATAELEPLEEHFAIQRISAINNLLYNLVTEWLQGRRLLPLEMLELEGLPSGGRAYDISEWLRRQSLTSLRERVKSKDGSLSGLNATAAMGLMSGAYDTLGVREIVIGSVKNDLTRDRCARAYNLLANSFDVFPEQRDEFSESRRNLYDSVCPN